MVNNSRQHVFLIASLALIVALHALLAVSGLSPVFKGELVDSDCYQRLGRAFDLVMGGGWHDSRQAFTNAPFGETLHWTRPLDLLLILGALPLSPFLGWQQALFLWGVMISPVLEIAALLILAWGTRRHVGERGILILACLLALSPGVSNHFMLGRPDHHSLLLLLYAANLSLLIRLLDQPQDSALVRGLGICSALAFWVSAEGIADILLGGAPLAILAARHGTPWFGALKRFSFWLAAGLVVALIAERPATDWAALEFDRLSGPAVLFFAGFAAGLHLLPSARQALARLSVIAIALTIGAGASLLLLSLTGAEMAKPFLAIAMSFSRRLGGQAEFDGGSLHHEIVYFFSTISEGAAIYPVDQGTRTLFFSQLGGACLALIQIAAWSRGGESEKRLALLHILGLALMIPLSLEQLRWTGYAQILALLPVSMLAINAWKTLVRPWRALVSLGVITAPVFLATLSGPPPGGSVLARPQEMCRWKEAANFLRHLPSSPGLLLTHAFPGPALAYWSGWTTVSSPFHRNVDGNRDMLSAFRYLGEGRAGETVRKRGVTHLLICPNDAEGTWLAGPKDQASFYRRLANSEPPAWLRAVALPPSLSAFRLYEVDRLSAPAPSGADGHNRG
jgi:hypothetical protein